MFKKNTSGQFIHVQGVDASTGGIKSGVTWTVRRCIDGTFAAATGTATEDGTAGWYKFVLSQADTNGNNIGFGFTGTGAVPQTINIITDGAPPDVNAKTWAGTAVTISATTALPEVDTKSISNDATAADNAELMFDGTGYAGGTTKLQVVAATVSDKAGYSISGTKTTLDALNDIAATAIVSAGPITTLSGAVVNVDLVDTLTTYTGNTLQTGDSFARIGADGAGLTALGDTRIANLDATVSTRATPAQVNAEADTAIADAALATAVNLATVAGYLDTEIAAILAAVDTETATLLSELAKVPKSDGTASWNATALAAIGDAAHDEVIEGALTHRQVTRLILSALAGLLSGAATTTMSFRDNANTKDRIVATVDADGNRSAIVLDAT